MTFLVCLLPWCLFKIKLELNRSILNISFYSEMFTMSYFGHLYLNHWCSLLYWKTINEIFSKLLHMKLLQPFLSIINLCVGSCINEPVSSFLKYSRKVKFCQNCILWQLEAEVHVIIYLGLLLRLGYPHGYHKDIDYCSN